MTQAIVKRVATGVAAAAGVLVLGVTTASAATVEPQQTGEVPPCTSDQLMLSTSEPRPGDVSDQYHLTIGFENISETTCGVDGLPTVDLVGPDDPLFGDTYRLPEGMANDDFVDLVPGQSAEIAEVTVLTPSEGAEAWTPNSIQITPPGEEDALTSDWGDLPVLRQDGATHPGSYVQGIG
ncbi:DUF4232 domain-containing protein [Prauserella cavernicola]|uniref:DUF4232 domain-containing protein n=1 Tax=Prauserella cavernicola TaxID=2800127 RepID=A0A934QVZ8_9PSEU|nr:DUF4232 domain-containing protein [Prauserella cavernicola]MBK1787430.1 DUF4232 domain-containing protein [Prauserella cavernicola]